MDTSFLRGQYCSMQGPGLGKTLTAFSPPGTVQKGGIFPVYSSLILLCPATKGLSSPIGFYHLGILDNQEQWQ